MVPSAESSEKAARRGVVAVVPRCDRLVVIERSEHVRAPGAYCFPGGEIEPGESEQQALVRELMEELRVDSEPIRKLWQSVTLRGVSLAWWLTDIGTQTPDPNPEEVASVHQLTIDEIRKLPNLLASNHQFLAALAAGEFHLSDDQ